MLVDGWRTEGSVGGGELTNIHLRDITITHGLSSPVLSPEASLFLPLQVLQTGQHLFSLGEGRVCSAARKRKAVVLYFVTRHRNGNKM